MMHVPTARIMNMMIRSARLIAKHPQLKYKKWHKKCAMLRLKRLAVLGRHPADKIDELLPSEWKKLNAEADADLGDDTAKIMRVT